MKVTDMIPTWDQLTANNKRFLVLQFKETLGDAAEMWTKEGIVAEAVQLYEVTRVVIVGQVAWRIAQQQAEMEKDVERLREQKRVADQYKDDPNAIFDRSDRSH